MNARTRTAYSLRPISYSEVSSIVEPRMEKDSLLGIPKNYFVILLAFLILIASSLFWVWVRVEHIKTAYHINDLQNSLVKLDEEQRLLEVERSSLRRPERLRQLAYEQFQMKAPTPNQLMLISSL